MIFDSIYLGRNALIIFFFSVKKTQYYLIFKKKIGFLTQSARKNT